MFQGRRVIQLQGTAPPQESVIRYAAEEPAERCMEPETAKLYIYPSLEAFDVGQHDAVMAFQVWAMTRTEKTLAYFGANGHTEEEGPGDFAKELAIALSDIENSKGGIFDDIRHVGTKILHAIKKNKEAEGFVLLAEE